MFVPKEVGINVPKVVYDPVDKTTEILTNSGVPADQVTAFIANPQSVDLTPYADAIKEEANMAPAEVAGSLATPKVPLSALFLVLCGLCTSVMWGGIFNLAVEGLGKYTAQASGIFMMMVVGGGVLPLIQNWLADITSYMTSYWIIIAGLAYLLWYALVGCKNVNKDIKVD